MGASGPQGRENGAVAEGDMQMLEGERERGKEIGVETGGGVQSKEEEEEEEEQEEGEEENTPFKPFVLPGECLIKVTNHLSLIYFTLLCSGEKSFNWFG